MQSNNHTLNISHLVYPYCALRPSDHRGLAILITEGSFALTVVDHLDSKLQNLCEHEIGCLSRWAYCGVMACATRTTPSLCGRSETATFSRHSAVQDSREQLRGQPT